MIESAGSTNPIADIKRAFRKYVKADIESGHCLPGCPLNNLAQEMSPLDDAFRTRIDALYTMWRKGFATALANGIKAGTVNATVAPKSVKPRCYGEDSPARRLQSRAHLIRGTPT